MQQENDVPPSADGALPDLTEPVTAGQIEKLCQTLSAESDAARQRHYWVLLQRCAPSSKALDLALHCILNPAALHRGEAVRYLRLHFPDRLPALQEAFSKDPDEELRYQLSEFLRDSDQDAAVGMKINLLRTASPELQERLIGEIAELGSLMHLEALQGLNELMGGGADSVFGRAAELLGRRTGSRGAGA
jgi:HEAT repeat protein